MRAVVVMGVLLATTACGSTSTPSGDAGVDAADVATPRDTSTGPRDTGLGGSACGDMAGSCNPISLVGCATGEGCYVNSTLTGGFRASCAAGGRSGWGATCARSSDCREGFACLFDGSGVGTCTMLCCGSDHSTCRDVSRGGRAGALCAAGVTNSQLRTCLEVMSCDPYAATGNRCPTERPRCDIVGDDGSTSCAAYEPMGTPVAEGQPCCTPNHCLAGLACIRTGSTACVATAPNGACRRVCDPTARPPVCGAGTHCAGLRDAAATFGVCLPDA